MRPQVSLVALHGMDAYAVEESKDRVSAALMNSAHKLPMGKTTRNPAPADVKQAGLSFDPPKPQPDQIQSSTCNPGTRRNSPRLFVINSVFKLRAWAAINVSSGPMGVPASSSRDRMSP